MSKAWTCPACGSREKRFSLERGREVCRQCGREVLTEAEYNANVAYQRTILLAKEHLSVGHWDTVCKMIEPLCADHPAEKQLYLMLLMAVTKGYEDYLLNDFTACLAAERYWDHLARLRCVNGAMADYARRRKSAIKAKEASYESKKVLILILCLILTLIALCTLLGREIIGIVFLVLAAFGWISFFRTKNPSGSLNKGNGHSTIENPFR